MHTFSFVRLCVSYAPSLRAPAVHGPMLPWTWEAQSELLSLKGERDMLAAALKAKESRLEEVQSDP